jgi:hypothetical protein
MGYTPGPKELELRRQREQRVEAKSRKPSKNDLRSKIANIKPKPKKGRGR